MNFQVVCVHFIYYAALPLGGRIITDRCRPSVRPSHSAHKSRPEGRRNFKFGRNISLSRVTDGDILGRGVKGQGHRSQGPTKFRFGAVLLALRRGVAREARHGSMISHAEGHISWRSSPPQIFFCLGWFVCQQDNSDHIIKSYLVNSGSQEAGLVTRKLRSQSINQSSLLFQ